MLYKQIHYEYNVNLGDFTFSNLKYLETKKKHTFQKDIFLLNHFLILTEYKTWYEFSKLCNITFNQLSFFDNIEIYLDYKNNNYIFFFESKNLLYGNVIELVKQLEKDNYCLSLTYKSWKVPFVYPLGIICSNFYKNKSLLKGHFTQC